METDVKTANSILILSYIIVFDRENIYVESYIVGAYVDA